MKKFTALGLSVIVGVSAIASSGMLTRKAILSKERPAVETEKKSVRLPMKMKGVSKRMPKGIFSETSVARLGRSTDPRKAAPAMRTPSNANLYGWLGFYSDDDGDTSERGLTKVNLDGTWSTIYNSESICLGIGVKDGVAYAQIYDDGYFGISYVADVTIDIATGEILSEKEIDLETEQEKFFYGMAYDMESMKGYGYHVVGGETIEFACKDLNTGEITGIAESENLYKMLTFNQSTGEVVCIDLDTSDLIGVNTSTGEETLKGTVDIASDYVGGLCYSPSDKAYIWNPNAQDWSYLVKVSETGETDKICDVPLAGQYQALFCTDLDAVDPGAPARPELKSIDFADGATSGSVTWSIPAVTESGDPLTGDVDYSVSLDGVEYKNGKVAAGSDLKVDFSGLDDGTHTFRLQISVDGKSARAVSSSQYVGNDTPKAPASVTLTESTVSWDPVTEGVHKGYLDLQALRYNVSLNGVTIAEGVESTSCPTGLAPGTPLDSYVAEVTAVCHGMTSAATSSNGIIFGEPMTLPVELQPTEQQASLFQISDENGDESSWEFVSDDEMGDCFRYQYGYEKADDWLFLPPVKIEDTARMVYFAMEYAVKASNMPEDFEVKIGKAADAESMTTTLLERHGASNTEYETAETYFTLPETGVYYIGIHAISEPDMFYIFARDFIVELSDITLAGPAEVTDIKATAAEMGALNATISFTLPEKTLGGDPLNKDTMVKATVKSDVDSKSVEGKPGSSQSVTLTTSQGLNAISVQAEADGKMGAVAKVNVYTGIDIPGIPTDIKAEISDNNYVATISWGAPTTGENGGYVKPTGITYYLCQYTIFGWAVIGEIGTDVFEYTVDIPEGSPLERYDIGVLCENEAGQASYLATVHPVLGRPYDLPAVEKFNDGNLTYAPVSVGGEAEVEYFISDPSEISEEYASDSPYAMIGECYDGGLAEITLPKFSTKGLSDAAFEITLFMHPGTKIYAQAYDTDRILLLDLKDLDLSGYQTLTATLPAELQDKGWVSFFISTDYSESETFVMTGYRIRNLVEHDLAASLAGTTTAALGETLKYVATITNEGTADTEFKGGKWTVGKGDEIIASATVDASEFKTLSPDESLTVEFQTEADASYIGEIAVSFALEGSDGYSANDSASLKVNVSRGEAVVVTDLEASITDNNVSLSWSAPMGKPSNESFEDETPFVLSPDKVGAFENVDRDGGEVYTWQNGDEIWDGAGKPGAFSVFSASQLDEITGETGMFEAADGDKFLIAFCPVPESQGGTADVADDWLISPKCEGGSEFAFSLRSLTEQYGDETLEVLVAKDSSSPDNFTLLESISICNEESWERFSFRLPADANYFAIRYTSEDIFGIMIDAIEFQPFGTTVDVKGYEVYRSVNSSDFTKIAETETSSYVDADADLKDTLSYYVVPVLSNGAKGEKSNIAVAKASGVDGVAASRSISAAEGKIIISGYEGVGYAVADFAGKTIAEGTASEETLIEVVPGMYIVRAGHSTAKLNVR